MRGPQQMLLSPYRWTPRLYPQKPSPPAAGDFSKSRYAIQEHTFTSERDSNRNLPILRCVLVGKIRGPLSSEPWFRGFVCNAESACPIAPNNLEIKVRFNFLFF